jgi:hypothetical protein
MPKTKKSNDELQTERLQLRVSPSFLRMVDDWRRKQPDIPPRAEAIRRMVAIAATRSEEAGKRRAPK